MQLTELNWNRSTEFINALKLHCRNEVSEELVIIQTKLILQATYQETSNLIFVDYQAQLGSFQIIHCPLYKYHRPYY